jgi:hypothetical protein
MRQAAKKATCLTVRHEKEICFFPSRQTSLLLAENPWDVRGNVRVISHLAPRKMLEFKPVRWKPRS